MILSLLKDHEGPLTYDFQAVHHVRLTDALLERDPDELLSLIFWLPEGSAFMCSLEAEGDRDRARRLYGWTRSHELVLAVANIGLRQAYILESAHSKSKVRLPEPLTGPRTPRKKGAGDASAFARGLMAAQGG